MASYKLNKAHNGIEIRFSEKPDKAVLEKLKAGGFRWSNPQKIWYAKQSEETIALAKEICSEAEAHQVSMFEDSEEEIEEPKVEVKTEKKATKKASTPSKTSSAAKTNIQKFEPKKSESKAEKPKAEKKDNVLVFPKNDRPNVKVVFREGNHTYDECLAKMTEETKIFVDSCNRYVIQGLLAMCEASPNFRNNLMADDKHYSDCYDYFVNMARNGYAYEYKNVTFMDNDLALAFAIDYYNSDTSLMNVETQIKRG